MARVNLTLNRIGNAKCPEGKHQAFIWDEKVGGLGVRITRTAKVYIFQWRLGSSNYPRMKLGDTRSLTLEHARKLAMEHANLVAKGMDPRQEQKRVRAREVVSQAEYMRKGITVGEIWPIYLDERKPHWSERHYLDHLRLTHAGGRAKKRGNGKTIPGALASLMDLPFGDITPETVKNWISRESATRKTQTRIGFEAFRAFLNWCDDHPDYKGIASPDACSAKVKKNNLPRKVPKDDCLQREQLAAWFTAVRSYHNRVISVYLQTLLLTGARREEILSLKWSELDLKWKSLTIKDKVEGSSPESAVNSPPLGLASGLHGFEPCRA